MIRASGLGYTFASGRTGLVSVDLEIAPGEIIALVGPNGSGKTTLLRLLAGDLVPAAGRLATQPPLSRAQTGFAHAETVHFDELTGAENARFFAEAYQAGDAGTRQCMRQFNLLADADLAAGEYSFGMQRKLLLVEALAHDPALVLLDEPTIGLDPAATQALAVALHDRARAGAMVVIATNDVAAALLATRIVFLHRGRKVADAPPAQLLEPVRNHTRITVSLATSPPRPPAFPESVVAAATGDGYVLDTADVSVLPLLCSALIEAGAQISSIQVSEAGLPDVFRHLTGEELGRVHA